LTKLGCGRGTGFELRDLDINLLSSSSSSSGGDGCELNRASTALVVDDGAELFGIFTILVVEVEVEEEEVEVEEEEAEEEEVAELLLPGDGPSRPTGNGTNDGGSCDVCTVVDVDVDVACGGGGGDDDGWWCWCWCWCWCWFCCGARWLFNKCAARFSSRTGSALAGTTKRGWLMPRLTIILPKILSLFGFSKSGENCVMGCLILMVVSEGASRVEPMPCLPLCDGKRRGSPLLESSHSRSLTKLFSIKSYWCCVGVWLFCVGGMPGWNGRDF